MATLKGVQLTLLIGPGIVAPAPIAVVEALESAQVTTAVGQRSGFQITFSYSKTSPIAKSLLPAGYFDPMIRVVLVATINGVPKVLADGPIRRQDVTASVMPGENKLTITGEDISSYMNLVDWTGTPFPALPVTGIVALLIAKYAMFGVIPLVVPPLFDSPQLPTDGWPAQQGTDFTFLNKLADDCSYEFYVTPGPVPGTNLAYFGPQMRAGLPQPAMTIDMDHASNVENMSFSADNSAIEMPIGHVRVGGFAVPVPAPDISMLLPQLSLRKLVPSKTKLLQTGRLKMPDVLKALLAKRTEADPVTATGSMDLVRYGTPLDARSIVGVRGAGLAHDGLYYVRSVTHVIGRGSWKQNFQLARDGLVSNVPLVLV